MLECENDFQNNKGYKQQLSQNILKNRQQMLYSSSNQGNIKMMDKIRKHSQQFQDEEIPGLGNQQRLKQMESYMKNQIKLNVYNQQNNVQRDNLVEDAQNKIQENLSQQNLKNQNIQNLSVQDFVINGQKTQFNQKQTGEKFRRIKSRKISQVQNDQNIAILDQKKVNVSRLIKNENYLYSQIKENSNNSQLMNDNNSLVVKQNFSQDKEKSQIQNIQDQIRDTNFFKQQEADQRNGVNIEQNKNNNNENENENDTLQLQDQNQKQGLANKFVKNVIGNFKRYPFQQQKQNRSRLYSAEQQKDNFDNTQQMEDILQRQQFLDKQQNFSNYLKQQDKLKAISNRSQSYCKSLNQSQNFSQSIKKYSKISQINKQIQGLDISPWAENEEAEDFQTCVNQAKKKQIDAKNQKYVYNKMKSFSQFSEKSIIKNSENKNQPQSEQKLNEISKYYYGKIQGFTKEQDEQENQIQASSKTNQQNKLISQGKNQIHTYNLSQNYLANQSQDYDIAKKLIKEEFQNINKTQNNIYKKHNFSGIQQSNNPNNSDSQNLNIIIKNVQINKNIKDIQQTNFEAKLNDQNNQQTELNEFYDITKYVKDLVKNQVKKSKQDKINVIKKISKKDQQQIENQNFQLINNSTNLRKQSNCQIIKQNSNQQDGLIINDKENLYKLLQKQKQNLLQQNQESEYQNQQQQQQDEKKDQNEQCDYFQNLKNKIIYQNASKSQNFRIKNRYRSKTQNLTVSNLNKLQQIKQGNKNNDFDLQQSFQNTKQKFASKKSLKKVSHINKYNKDQSHIKDISNQHDNV
ncbi:hypothetical protein PPERSA_11443 [Pseudocohnilembus persalinus]|uniref:Uncharacterized protein n=1 Tax=Pseudocohnilembus persalinus TaxID=266149 RepID=A0A0V0QX46_PSEPJ|nr:hypothetical protein PPERSA_11443 [Pseudocohnilembus persalinus]|eukprot:KRX06798.1 hypothetical protein PPERSA_11443 [Pseudocohnilembus persalinus]